MAHLQARPDRARLYGLLKGVGIAALVVVAYIAVMKSMGHQLASDWDKQAAEMTAPCLPTQIGAAPPPEGDPCR